MGVLISKPGITSASTLSIPKEWSPSWFRNLIDNQLKGADVRNAVGIGGISVSGNIASPYATIGFKAPVSLPGPVTISAPTVASTNALVINGISGTPPVSIFAGSAGGAAINFGNSYSTGTATATFSATNKPGSNSGVVTWIPIAYGGTLGYIPVWS